MRLLITLIGWEEYPADGTIPDPYICDLSERASLTNLIIMFGNGVIGEMRAEGDSLDALKILSGVIHGPGACRPHVLTPDELTKLWIYHSGDECYIQEGTPPGYIFVNPKPQPHLFAASTQ